MFKKEMMIKATIIIGFLILLVPALVMAEMPLLKIKVDCNKGQSVQSALDKLIGPATIVVTGTCTENLVITKDDVTLQGGSYVPADAAQNTILINGARRILMTGVTVTGGRNGITAYQGASLTIDGNSNISGATQNGVVAVYGSSATVNFSIIEGNLQGVTAADNSSIVLTNSEIKDNTGTGVLVVRSSSARIGQTLTAVSGPNEIKDNSGSGVSISRCSNALVDGNTISNNAGDGINVDGSSATVTNNTISGSTKGVSVHNSGSARIGITDGNQAGPNTIENNSLEGIQSANGGAAYIYANTIRNNGIGTGRAGVAIYRATGRLLGKNEIKNNAGHGVEVDLGALFQGTGDFNLPLERDKISDNDHSGISGWNGAQLDIRNVEVKNNTENGIVLSLRSTLRIYDATVSNNGHHGIAVFDGSAASFNHPAASQAASITLNTYWGVWCLDGESSYNGDTSGVTLNTGGQISCTGF